MQKKAIRRIFNTQYNEHTNNYYMELIALKIIALLKYKTWLFMHKSSTNSLPKNVQNLFLHKYCHVHTRKSGNIQQIYVRTTKKQMRISMDESKLWNSMETILKEETSMHMLRYKYKQIIMGSYIKNGY